MTPSPPIALSVIVALFAIVNTLALSVYERTASHATLVILLVVGAPAGVLAAIAPARRASRIDVLLALTHR
jgi:ABC-type lipoprotein release transport system permease subunit